LPSPAAISAMAEIAAGDGNAKTLAGALEHRRDRFDRSIRTDRIVIIASLHGVVGEREIARRARQRPNMVEARNEGKATRAREPPIGRLEAENPA